MDFWMKSEKLRATGNILVAPYSCSEEQSNENDSILGNWNILIKNI